MDIHMRIKIAGRDDETASSDPAKPAATFAKELTNALRLEGKWALYDARVGSALDPTKSLEQNGVVDGHVLELRQVHGAPSPTPPPRPTPRPGTGLRLDVATPDDRSETTEAEPGEMVRELIDELKKTLKLEGWFVLHDQNQGDRRLDPKKTLQQNRVRDGHHLKLVLAAQPRPNWLSKHRKAVALAAAALLLLVLVIPALMATLCASLFAGAAVYITLVEHPARMECGSAFAVKEFAPSYRRAAWMQASVALVGFVSAVVAWLAGGRDSSWWLAAGALLGAVVPFTLVVIRPVNKQLVEPSLDPSSQAAVELLNRWGRLHVVRSALGLAALIVMLVLLASGR